MSEPIALMQPPRLLNPTADGAYDWRELDRFLRQLTQLLGASTGGALNLYQGYLDNLTCLNSPTVQTSTASTYQNEEMPSFLQSSPAQATTQPNDDALTLYWIGV